jgi:hypothetical protein
MSTLREAAQQALEALKDCVKALDALHAPGDSIYTRASDSADRAEIALRAALAQQTQTPCDIAEDGVCEVIDCCRNSTQEEQEPTVRFKCTVVDDQHPNGVPFEQWVNAPQEEPGVCGRCGGLVYDPVVVQQEQEPVAWSPSLTYPNYEKERVWLNGKPRQEDVEYWSENGNGITYVYTAPPRREWQGLRNKEIVQIVTDNLTGGDWVDVARAIEAKLKEKNHG